MPAWQPIGNRKADVPRTLAYVTQSSHRPLHARTLRPRLLATCDPLRI